MKVSCRLKKGLCIYMVLVAVMLKLAVIPYIIHIINFESVHLNAYTNVGNANAFD